MMVQTTEIRPQNLNCLLQRDKPTLKNVIIMGLMESLELHCDRLNDV